MMLVANYQHLADEDRQRQTMQVLGSDFAQIRNQMKVEPNLDGENANINNLINYQYEHII